MTSHSRQDDYLHIDAPSMMKELLDISKEYNDWYAKLIEGESKLKSLEAELYFEYKAKGVGEKITQKDIEFKIKTDLRYRDLKLEVDRADVMYARAKVKYNNKNTEISLKQSELKRELLLQRSH